MRYGLLFLIALMTACGPAVTDGEYSITGATGYALSDTGGNGEFIVRRKSGQPNEIVIAARVMSFRIEDGRILATRRPMRITQKPDGTLAGSLEDTCQFLSVNIATNEVQVLAQPVVGLSCSENQWLERKPE